MTKFLFIRHGQADYDPIDARGFIGQGMDLAGLTQKGVDQIKVSSLDDCLKGSDLIISSPYTRALQSAAILSRNLDLEIVVEVDLHEWIPDIKQYAYDNIESCILLARDYNENNGIIPVGEERVWETRMQIISRLEKVLEKYKAYNQVIVVSHGMVIGTQVTQKSIKNGEIILIER